MALTANTFLKRFGHFGSLKDAENRINEALTMAYERCGAALGVHQDTAAGYLAAHLLATDPRNENMGQVKGQPATTFYYVEYERIVTAGRPVGVVAAPDLPPLDGGS